MTLRYQTSPTLILLALICCISIWVIPSAHAQGQVQVSAADPMSVEQGTINLNVKVTGNGFKEWRTSSMTGTTNPVASPLIRQTS